jgi:hypothetical protein
MESVTVRDRFRPARIAFVIPQDDASAFEQAVRLNTALLGGMYRESLLDGCRVIVGSLDQGAVADVADICHGGPVVD